MLEKWYLFRGGKRPENVVGAIFYTGDLVTRDAFPTYMDMINGDNGYWYVHNVIAYTLGEKVETKGVSLCQVSQKS